MIESIGIAGGMIVIVNYSPCRYAVRKELPAIPPTNVSESTGSIHSPYGVKI